MYQYDNSEHQSSLKTDKPTSYSSACTVLPALSCLATDLGSISVSRSSVLRLSVCRAPAWLANIAENPLMLSTVIDALWTITHRNGTCKPTVTLSLSASSPVIDSSFRQFFCAKKYFEPCLVNETRNYSLHSDTNSTSLLPFVKGVRHVRNC